MVDKLMADELCESIKDMDNIDRYYAFMIIGKELGDIGFIDSQLGKSLNEPLNAALAYVFEQVIIYERSICSFNHIIKKTLEIKDINTRILVRKELRKRFD